MEHLILTETEFFRLIGNPDNHTELNSAYNEFTTMVVSLCTGTASSCHPIPALNYAETELQYHDAIQDVNTCRSMYVRKALSFVRKMLKYLATSQTRALPLSSIHPNYEKKNMNTDNIPAMRWSGSMAELVELIYGLDAMKLVNEGEPGIKELLEGFCKVFGMEIKESQCYNTYADIKRRKNESRTYFFDKAAEKLNRRIQEDEGRERMRKR